MPNLIEVQQAVETDEQPVRITINDRLGDPYLAHDGTEAWIDVLGSQSKAYQRAVKRENRRLLKGRRLKASDADLMESRIEKALAAVADWHPQGWWENESANGDPEFMEATPDNVRKVLVHQHILQQVEEGIHDHEAFFRSASTD